MPNDALYSSDFPVGCPAIESINTVNQFIDYLSPKSALPTMEAASAKVPLIKVSQEIIRKVDFQTTLVTTNSSLDPEGRIDLTYLESLAALELTKNFLQTSRTYLLHPDESKGEDIAQEIFVRSSLLSTYFDAVLSSNNYSRLSDSQVTALTRIIPFHLLKPAFNRLSKKITDLPITSSDSGPNLLNRTEDLMPFKSYQIGSLFQDRQVTLTIDPDYITLYGPLSQQDAASLRNNPAVKLHIDISKAFQDLKITSMLYKDLVKQTSTTKDGTELYWIELKLPTLGQQSIETARALLAAMAADQAG